MENNMTKDELIETDHYKAKFPITAGVVVRGQLRRLIKQLALKYKLECEIDEDRGWIESLFIVEWTGEKGRLQAAVNELTLIMKEHE